MLRILLFLVVSTLFKLSSLFSEGLYLGGGYEGILGGGVTAQREGSIYDSDAYDWYFLPNKGVFSIFGGYDFKNIAFQASIERAVGYNKEVAYSEAGLTTVPADVTSEYTKFMVEAMPKLHLDYGFLFVGLGAGMLDGNSSYQFKGTDIFIAGGYNSLIYRMRVGYEFNITTYGSIAVSYAYTMFDNFNLKSYNDLFLEFDGATSMEIDKSQSIMVQYKYKPGG